ncbi:hypothetical protein [Acinetobacter baumannii]|uniref:hypothetical protein n=1 Tax=Acinetobacter baumannii TaxID=470 RepID=UPI0012EE26CD|nr:hypothetical protein [Acinetobacter baumannii]MVO25850.1 hypothetical protein [Acinetobacter baumannii]
MASRLTLFLKSTVVKMAMTLEQTRQAIIDRMQSFTGIAQDRIQYPNAPGFNVPKDGVWCRLTIAGGPSFNSGIADKPSPYRLSDALLAHFEYFTIEHLECLNGQSIYAGKDADFIQYNVSIGYKVN